VWTRERLTVSQQPRPAKSGLLLAERCTHLWPAVKAQGLVQACRCVPHHERIACGSSDASLYLQQRPAAIRGDSSSTRQAPPLCTRQHTVTHARARARQSSLAHLVRAQHQLVGLAPHAAVCSQPQLPQLCQERVCLRHV
jgi:hypothetical protein